MSAPLADLGLDRETFEFYRTLVARPGWNLAELAEHARLEVEQVRSALDRLVELGLVRRGADEALAAVSPSVGLVRLLAQQERTAQEALASVARAKQDLALILAELSTAGADDPVSVADGAAGPGPETLEGLAAIRQRLVELAASVRSEVLTFVPGGAQPRESLEASLDLDLSVLRRGVSLRTIYLTSAASDAVTRSHVNRLAVFGAEFRTTPSLPLRMVLVDRAMALVPIDLAHSAAGALVVRTPGTVAALVALFEAHWRAASEFGKPRDRGDSVTELERAVLARLAAGARDEDVAVELGVSARTVRRTIAALTDRLGVQGRFAAGVAAARAGWVGLGPDGKGSPGLQHHKTVQREL